MSSKTKKSKFWFDDFDQSENSIMKKFRFKNTLTIFVAITAFGCCVQISFAEGHRDNFENAQGVNRVVRTNSNGFYQIHGAGWMAFTGVPTVVAAHGVVDKPSFYLGGTSGGGTQLDAGLQYEPLPLNGILPGWSAFISSDSDFCRPQVLRDADKASVPWRGTNGAPAWIASGVEFRFNNDGSAQTTIGVMGTSTKVIVPNSGTFFYNTSPGASIATPNHPIAPYQSAVAFTGSLTNADVKYVIAMTRNFGGAGSDGSQLTGKWSGCTVVNNSGTYDLSSNMINQGATGYDSPANENVGAKDGKGNWKVDFPALNISSQQARTDTSPSHLASTPDPNNPTASIDRYTTETVGINLLLPTSKGKGLPKPPR